VAEKLAELSLATNDQNIRLLSFIHVIRITNVFLALKN
jgi:hypothetical protein